jgi:hypothetical protein
VTHGKGRYPSRPNCMDCGKPVHAVIDYCYDCKVQVCGDCKDKPKHREMHPRPKIRPYREEGEDE